MKVQDSCHWPEGEIMQGPAQHKPPASWKCGLLVFYKKTRPKIHPSSHHKRYLIIKIHINECSVYSQTHYLCCVQFRKCSSTEQWKSIDCRRVLTNTFLIDHSTALYKYSNLYKYSDTQEKINSIVYSVCWQCHHYRHSATRELTCPGLVFLESPLHFDWVGQIVHNEQHMSHQAPPEYDGIPQQVDSVVISWENLSLQC